LHHLQVSLLYNDLPNWLLDSYFPTVKSEAPSSQQLTQKKNPKPKTLGKKRILRYERNPALCFKTCEKAKENQSETAGQILPFDSVANSYFQWDLSQGLLVVYIGLSLHPTPLLPVSSSGS